MDSAKSNNSTTNFSNELKFDYNSPNNDTKY